MTLHTLRDVLEVYLHTRRWQREQEANALSLLANQGELQALIAGLKENASQLVKPYRDAAAALRRPELWRDPDRAERDQQMTDAQRLFIRRSREEEAKPVERSA